MSWRTHDVFNTILQEQTFGLLSSRRHSAAEADGGDSLGHDYYRFYYNFPVRPRAIIEPPAQDPKRAEGFE
jgi:hypothetical protein